MAIGHRDLIQTHAGGIVRIPRPHLILQMDRLILHTSQILISYVDRLILHAVAKVSVLRGRLQKLRSGSSMVHLPVCQVVHWHAHLRLVRVLGISRATESA